MAVILHAVQFAINHQAKIVLVINIVVKHDPFLFRPIIITVYSFVTFN